MTRIASEGPVLNGRIEKGSDKAPSTGSRPKNFAYLSSRRKEGFHDRSATAFNQWLGPTSYSAIYRENQASLADAAWPIEEDPEQANGDQDEVQHVVFASGDVRDAMDSRMNFGLTILSYFPEKHLADRLMEKSLEGCGGRMINEQTLRFWYESLWTTYGDNLPSKAGGNNLQRFLPLAQRLFNNEKKKLPYAKSTKEWLDGFLGENIRWEILGIICGIFGVAILNYPETEPIFITDTIKSKRQYASILTECAEGCVVLCEEADVNNELAVWCRHICHLLASQYNGDTSYQLWKTHGTLSSAITMIGLHRGNDLATSPSFLVCDLRKNIFMSAFGMDKQLATVTGRPPALSRRYCAVQLPVDLDDEELMAEGGELEHLLSKLDSRGWRTDGKVTKRSLARAWYSSLLIRDEVLELSLGVAAGFSPERRDEILRKNEEIYRQLPIGLQHGTEGAPAIDRYERHQCGERLSIRLEFWLNRLLLERLTGLGRHHTTQGLVDSAREMLKLLVFLSEPRRSMCESGVELAWHTIYYGFPCAGILAIELLKQTKSPYTYRLDLPRSEVIQNLSVFVSSINGISSSEPNYNVCMSMQKVTQHILDRILSPLVPTPVRDPAPALCPNDSVDELAPTLDFSSLMGTMDDPDLTDWLNTVNWGKEPWAETYWPTM